MTIYSQLIDNSLLKLKNKADHLLNLIEPSALTNLKESLLKKIDFFCSPTVATEDEISSMQGLCKRTLEDIFSEYQELEKIVNHVIENWLNATVEFLERLASDFDELTHLFDLQGKVQSISLYEGDSHNGGRGVIKLIFSNGKKIIYKPKNIEISKAFFQIWKGYRILCKPTYGWEEFVEPIPCQNLPLYFERAGHLLCLLHLLAGVDFQIENIIPSNDIPYVIDTETLMHNQIYEKYFNFVTLTNAEVLKTGFLPVFMATGQGGLGVDMSGLKAGGFFPEKHIEEIVRGFHRAYQEILKDKESFLQTASKLAQCPTRTVIRPTVFYHYLLKRVCLPQNLLNPKHREKELEALSLQLSQEGKSALKVIVEEEKRAILQGDIPFFSSYPLQKHLFCKGQCLVENVFEKSSFEIVKEKIEHLSQSDLLMQEDLIRQSFCIFNTTLHEDKQAPKIVVKEVVPKDKIWNEIFSIAENLQKKALKINGQVSWIALEPDLLSNQYHLRPLTNALYEGRCGIALFYAALSHATQNEKYKAYALEILNDIRGQIFQQDLVRIHGLGGFSGIGGISYALNQIGILLQEPSLIKDAKNLLSTISEEAILRDNLHDVIGGSAGLIMSIMSLNDSQFFPLAKVCGDHICSKGLEKDFHGFSHGGSGIAHALFQLASLTNNEKYREGALKAIAFENKLPKGDVTRWCRGLTGIGMSRLACSSFFQDDEAIQNALTASIEHLHDGSPPRLCCSSLGRIEFLSLAADKLQNIEYKKLAYSSLPTAIESFRKDSPFYKPGLMQGEAGLGYTLLRMVSEKNLPNVLLLTDL